MELASKAPAFVFQLHREFAKHERENQLSGACSEDQGGNGGPLKIG